MKLKQQLMGLAGIALLTSVGLSACNRHEEQVSAHMAMSSDAASASQDSSNPEVADSAASALYPGGDGSLARNTPPDTLLGNEPTGAGMPTSSANATAASALLSSAEKKFLHDAAIGGQYELAVAQLAKAQAGDSSVKSYAAMLVNDHTLNNKRLDQLAQRHSVILPTDLPPEKQAVIDKLTKLNGAEFDRQFIQTVGLHDHKNDIGLFEKASQEAKDPEVREFAASVLPTLRSHLSAAQNLPSSVRGSLGSPG